MKGKIIDEDDGINFHKTYPLESKKEINEFSHIIREDLEEYGKSIPYLGKLNAQAVKLMDKVGWR